MSAWGCDKCEHGWRTVSESWVLRTHPMPERVDGQTDESFAEAVRQVEMRRVGARHTVYPCKECRPEDFYRWVGGHLDPDHERSSCAECHDVSSSSPHRRRRSHRGREAEPMPEPPPEIYHEQEML